MNQEKNQNNNNRTNGSIKAVAFSAINRDRAKMRAALDEDAVERYAERYKLSEPMEPGILIATAEGLLVGDCWHRLAAMELLGWTEGTFEVWQGTEDDAVVCAAASQLGVPRGRDDRRLAVEWMLRNNGAGRSNRDIAGLCGVSPTTVGNYRDELEQSEEVAPAPFRKGKDGKVRRGPRRSPTVQNGQLTLPRQPGLSLVGGPDERESVLRGEIESLKQHVKELQRGYKPVSRLLAMLDVDTLDEAIKVVRGLLGEEISAAA